MKVISTILPDLYMGILATMTYIMQENIRVWDTKRKPAFDVLDEFDADYLMCDRDLLDSSIVEAVRKTNIGFISVGIVDTELIKPDLMICPGNLKETTKKNVENMGIPICYIKESANIAQIFGGEFNEKMSCDVSLVVDKDSIKYNPQIVNVITKLSNLDIKVKVFGDNKIPIPQYLGQIGTKNISTAYKSSTINLDFGGKNLLNIAANKCFSISNMENGLYPNFTSLDNLQELIEHYIKEDKHRKSVSKQAHKNVMNNDTCFHRTRDIFSTLGQTELANKTIEKLNENRGSSQ